MEIDYAPFLHVLPDGSIWWPLEIAAKLGAGFLPLRDDAHNLVPTLQAQNNRVRAGERTLLSEFIPDNYTGAHPRIVRREDGRYVEAREFLTWLLHYLNGESPAPFPFPDALAEAVSRATKRPNVRNRRSSEFTSLTIALAGFFDTEFEDLPDALRQRVRQEFFPIGWIGLSGRQRREFALQMDYQHDPETEDERQQWWDFFERMREVKDQIAKWETIATPTASDLALRESRLADLRRQLAQMDAHQRQARGDYLPQRPTDKTSPVPVEGGQYIAYPKAMAQLKTRLGATVEELAAWILRGPDDGGLTAYMNANELDPPPRFYYTVGSENPDYVAPLMACWFAPHEIDQFSPTERYMTGQALIERWSARPSLHAVAFICAKIAESRLLDIHPIYGGTRGTFAEHSDWPPLESGLFAVSQVEHIEATDFAQNELGEAPQRPENTVESVVADTAPNNAVSTRASPTAGREVRKLATQAMYRSWQKQYRKLNKQRPNMSDIWYSQQIAKQDIGKQRDAETIRKHMKL